MEFIMGLGIGGVVLAITGTLWFYTAQSWSVVFSYVDLNNKSQYALNRFTQQVRRVQSVKSASSNQLTFVDADGADLTFRYFPEERTFVRQKNGENTTYLTECDHLFFSIFQRNPIAGSYDQFPAADTNSCKLVQVQWTCSRSLLHTNKTTETFRSAKVVIRRK